MSWKIVYFEKYKDKNKAIKRENSLKTGYGRKIYAEVAKAVTARV